MQNYNIGSSRSCSIGSVSLCQRADGVSMPVDGDDDR